MNILLEHDSRPGVSYDNHLIIGGSGCILNEMDLKESNSNGFNSLKFRGKFQAAEEVNKNKRIYPYDILEANVSRLKETIDAGGLLGECDHPLDSIIHFANASHKVTKLWWEGNNLMGEGVILNTPMGKLLRALINDGVRIGISSRGVGNGKVNENGILVIGESYKLITFDAVADPSTYAAFQEKVVSNKKENTIHSQNRDIFVKNESRGIYNKSNTNILLACLNGIVKNKVNEIKARI